MDMTKVMKELASYDNLRKRLFLRLSNRDRNPPAENLPHQDFGEFTVTCHADLTDFAGEAASAAVTKDLLQAYGVSEEQLFADAYLVAPSVKPSRTEGLGTFLERIWPTVKTVDRSGTEPLDVNTALKPDPKPDLLFLLTTEDYAGGASAILYPGLLENLSGGRNLFLIPSSVHEFLYTADDGNTDPSGLEQMIQKINRRYVAPEEFLSDRLYYYDQARREIRLAIPDGPSS